MNALFGAAALFAFGPGPFEMVIIGIIAVLLFGNRLPEVARSLGKGMSEFKKGMSDLTSEIDSSSSRRAQRPRYNEIDDRDVAVAPKFEPPASEPTPLDASATAGDNVADGEDGKIADDKVADDKVADDSMQV